MRAHVNGLGIAANRQIHWALGVDLGGLSSSVSLSLALTLE